MASYAIPVAINQTLQQLDSLLYCSELGVPPYWRNLMSSWFSVFVPEPKYELRKLMDVLSTIRSILLDVDERMLPSINERSWIAKLGDAVYDASDLSDLLLLYREITLSKDTLPIKIQEMGVIRRRLDKIIKMAGQAQGIVFRGHRSRVVGTKCYSKRYLSVPKDIVGREEDKDRLISNLLSSLGYETERIDVIPIIGIVGMGKTTLAMMVFNDERIIGYFYERLWVCASRKFNLENVIRDIIQSANGNSSAENMEQSSTDSLSLYALEEELKSVFGSIGRWGRGLLVLDDVWFIDRLEWMGFIELLHRSLFTGIIIVTTQDEGVASVVETGGSYRLEGLSDHDSWSLFAKTVFTEGEENAYPRLVQMGKSSILPKCKGVPLAVKTLAGKLRTARDHQSWQKIAVSELWEISQNPPDILPALKMIFDRLPCYLKACFAYCSVFEKGYHFRRSELVNLWIAQGLLQLTSDYEIIARYRRELPLTYSPEWADNMRGTGYRAFSELIRKSFFQIPRLVTDKPVEKTAEQMEHYEKITLEFIEYAHMHDLFHDLAVYLAKEETAIVNSNMHDVSETVRHIVWDREDMSGIEFPKGLKKAGSRARTFAFLHPMGSVSKSFLESLLSNFKLLRVLMLKNSTFEELPDLIGDLKHLRLLALDLNTQLKMLPDSTCNLLNLQTLDTRHCNQLEKLPNDLHKLINLRSLSLTFKLRCFPDRASRVWTNLQHLQIVECPALESLSEEFASLEKLQVLEIGECNKLVSLPDSMGSLTNIEELKIYGCNNLDLTRWKGLCGLLYLRKLVFLGLPRMVKFPEGINSVARTLRFLKIGVCEELRGLPEGLQHCTSLLKLELYSCKNMRALPTGLHALKNLHQLIIKGCPELIAGCGGDDCINWSFISKIPRVSLDFKPQLASMDVTHNNAGTNEEKFNPGEKNSIAPDGSVITPQSSSKKIEDSAFGNDSHDIELAEDQPLAPLTLNDHGFDSLENADATASSMDTPTGLSMRVIDVFDDLQMPGIVSQETEPEDDADGGGNMMLEMEPSSSSNNENKQLDEEAMPNNGIEGLAEIPDELTKSCGSIFHLLSKDYVFEKDTLVQLWMGIGVIPNEAAGESCFNHLFKKGRILFSGTNFVTGINSYRPNVERICADLSLQSGDNSRFYLKWEDGHQHSMSIEIQHVSLLCYDIDIAEVFRTLSNFSELRTLIFLGKYGHRVKEVPDHLFESMKGLHILDLSRTSVRNLPSSLRCLAHLHYLDLSWTPIDQLPETLCFLDELQTLKLRGCSSLRRLPEQLRMLTALRHLDIDVLCQLTTMPKGIGALKDLRTLPGFLVSIEGGCKIGELENLNNLTGSFCVAMLENVDSEAEVKRAALWKKDFIRKLELRWTASQYLKMDNETCNTLDYLKPSSSLEELKVLCYGGLFFPDWIADTKLNKLVSLTLFMCDAVSKLPSVEQLPSLRYLTLVKMNGVMEISRQVSCDHVAFPKLEKLNIDEMLSLQSWSWMEANEGDFECLAELNVNNCPKLRKIDVLPYLLSVRHIEIRECSGLESLADKKLPDGLQDLIVEDCPQVEARSKKGTADWWKIQHVPNIHIGISYTDEDTDTNENYEDEDSVAN